MGVSVVRARMPTRAGLPACCASAASGAVRSPPVMAPRNTRRSTIDHLIGSCQKGRGNREAERLRGLEVHDELKGRGLFDREIEWPGPSQDLVYKYRNARNEVPVIGAVGHQTAQLDELAPLVACWRSTLGRQFHQRPAIPEETGIRGHEQGVWPRSRDHPRSFCVVASALDLHRLQVQPERCPGSSERGELLGVAGIIRIHQYSDATCPG